MDIFTHLAVGVVLSQAGLRRVTPNADVLLMLAATIPDIDILSLANGQLADLAFRRGYTHTLLALPVLALLCVALTALVSKSKNRLISAWMVASIGVASHLLLDWTESYGIRALLPFSSRWFYLDLNGSYDSVILVALALALVWPLFAGLVSGEIGQRAKGGGRGSATAVLLFLVLYDAGRWTLHQQSLTALNSRLYDGQVPLSVAALPQPNNPFGWTGVIETEDAFRLIETGSFDIGDSSDARVFIKPEKSPAYLAAMRTKPFQLMAYFSRFPVWEVEPVTLPSGATRFLDMSDLRYGTPGEGTFHASALFNDTLGKLLVSEFNFSAKRSRELMNGGP